MGGRKKKMDVSVVVLTYKRQDELLSTLETVFAQDPAPVDVVVVNNNPDDTGEIVRRSFPDVVFIDAGNNIGCEARNLAVAAAGGDIVITIDNDVHLFDSRTIARVAGFFERHPGAGCVNFKVLTPERVMSLRDWCHPRDHAVWSGMEFMTDHISEGASAFRKKAFTAVGGYYAPFFIGHEGPELNVRLMDAGYETWYSPDIEVTHYASKAARPGWRAYYYNTRNNIWLAYRHYPAFYALRYIAFYTSMMFFYALTAGHLAGFFRGLSAGVGGLGSIDRKVVSDSGYTRLRAIWSMKPSFSSKVRKHFASRQSYR